MNELSEPFRKTLTIQMLLDVLHATKCDEDVPTVIADFILENSMCYDTEFFIKNILPAIIKGYKPEEIAVAFDKCDFTANTMAIVSASVDFITGMKVLWELFQKAKHVESIPAIKFLKMLQQNVDTEGSGGDSITAPMLQSVRDDNMLQRIRQIPVYIAMPDLRESISMYAISGGAFNQWLLKMEQVPGGIIALKEQTNLPLIVTLHGTNGQVDRILKFGCDFSVSDEDGNTPLHLAAKNQDLYQLLLSHGDCTKKNKAGRSPENLFRGFQSKEVYAIQERYASLKDSMNELTFRPFWELDENNTTLCSRLCDQLAELQAALARL
jgi:hypothetical protein